MVYPWCTECLARECPEALANGHRAQRLLQYRADFMVGGRYGKRIRKLFPTKKDAEAFEYVTLADFKRGSFIPAPKSKLLFKDFYLEYKELKIDRYMRGAKAEDYRLKTFREKFLERPLHLFKVSDWDEYVSMRLKDGIAQTTINRELNSVKTMFKWAVEKGHITTNPFKTVQRFKVLNVKVRWLDEKEISKQLQYVLDSGDTDLHDLLVVALNTGFRKANLERLSAHDIVNNRIQAVKTKSGKAYDVPINSVLAEVLKRLIAARPSGPILNFYNFRKRFDRANLFSDVTLHTYRHTFAAQCLKRGIPIDRVCSWLGHHSVEFTRQHYGHLCPNQEAAEINLLNLGATNGLQGRAGEDNSGTGRGREEARRGVETGSQS